MSTSEWSYLVALDTSVDFVSDAPLDALSARVLLSNANLLCDEFAQVRLALTDKTGLTPAAVQVHDALVPLVTYAFPISVKSDGSAYVFRIRLGGYVTGGATATIRAVIGPYTLNAGRYVIGGYGDREFLTSSLGGADAWLTGTSQGTGNATLIMLPAALVRYEPTDTIAAIGGASDSVDVPMASLTLYGETTSASHPPIITGVYLAEYIGL